MRLLLLCEIPGAIRTYVRMYVHLVLVGLTEGWQAGRQNQFSNFSIHMYIHTVLLNYNFIFTRVITRGTTRILHCIPVTCLRRPRLLIACNVHVSWKYMRGSTHVEAHAWKYTRGTKHRDTCTHM